MNLPELHIFVGAGGVGKTTLSAAYAIARAAEGKRVALLSIDPAKRLQSALGQKNLAELGTTIDVGQNGGALVASVLYPHQTLRRWAAETTKSAEAQKRLDNNAFFNTLCDKVASATDTIAAMRIAEWATMPNDGKPFDLMVIDTAPGLHAIDFLTKPDRLLAFFDSKLIEWLKWFVSDSKTKVGLFQKMVMSGARKILDGLALVGGQNMLMSFAEFIVALEGMIAKMIERIQISRVWLKSPRAKYFIVAAVRPDAAATAQALSQSLIGLGVQPTASIINRALDKSSEGKLASLLNEKMSDESRTFLTFVVNFLKMQTQLKQQLKSGRSTIICELPNMQQLDAAGSDVRLADLQNLGQNLTDQLLNPRDEHND